ncbi:hypothetical protein GXW74_15745 [Roseomonas eburnea]|uniref:Uncharacterized protein n=1 Tax=Neoroseomonas eburnea TaxID=1346889 RepID=A0A9X9XE12_9PROT|nr:hypothetical protein [Neoroseomonas eburnea]MBR0681948.1 hypothetical protein [Neoroseomonas eburnea]
MPAPFVELADGLEDLSAIFEGKQRHGGTISAGQARAIKEALKAFAELARLGDRQRIAALQIAGRPVEDGVTVVLAPFTVLPGGRA